MKKIELNQNDAPEVTETTEPTVENHPDGPTIKEQLAAPIEYRTTSTGRPTLVGTRKCTECGRAEFHTKKFEKSGNPEDLNQRYTLCKGVCVYCYAQKRNKTAGSSLTVPQLEAKIKFYQDLLTNAQAAATTTTN